MHMIVHALHKKKTNCTHVFHLRENSPLHVENGKVQMANVKNGGKKGHMVIPAVCRKRHA